MGLTKVSYGPKVGGGPTRGCIGGIEGPIGEYIRFVVQGLSGIWVLYWDPQ